MPNRQEYLDRLAKNVSYADPIVKTQFHNTARKFLKELAAQLPEYGEFDVRSNKGGIAVSGEVTLHMDRLYVQVAQSVMGLDRAVMFRPCNGRKDYSGGMNNFTSMETLLDTSTLAALIKGSVKPNV